MTVCQDVTYHLIQPLTKKTGTDELELNRLEPLVPDPHQEDDKSYRAHAQADVKDIRSSRSFQRLELE